MTQLSPSNSQFDRFLFAPLYENGETSLSVLSALARQDIDAWQEAARLDQLSKEPAINSFASTIWKSDSERWSPSEANLVAASLIELLPSHNDTHDSLISNESKNGKLMMWLAYGILLGSIAMSGNSNLQSTRSHHQSKQTNSVVVQQDALSQSFQRERSDKRNWLLTE
jgi:hypothetical protein